MSTIRFLLPFVLLLIGCPMVYAEGEENHPPLLAPIPSEAKRLALETMDAVAGDDVKVRDADWSFTLNKTESQFLRVTLFAQNHYWFAVASPASGVPLKITVYDRDGHPVKGEVWQDTTTHSGSRAAIGLIPTQSGEYFIGVSSGENSTDLTLDCALVMAYK